MGMGLEESGGQGGIETARGRGSGGVGAEQGEPQTEAYQKNRAKEKVVSKGGQRQSGKKKRGERHLTSSVKKKQEKTRVMGRPLSYRKL